jgi:hypothetical protein
MKKTISAIVLSFLFVGIPFVVYAANWQRSGNVVEKEWDGKSPLVFGVLSSPPNEYGCDGDDKVLKFDISVFARLAGSSFDVNNIYIDGITYGEYALAVWFDNWEEHGYDDQMPVLLSNGLNWSNQNKIGICVGTEVQLETLDSQLQSIVFWYDGPIGTTNDYGDDMSDPDESKNDAGTGPIFGGPGTSTKPSDSSESGKPDFVVKSLKLRDVDDDEQYEFDPTQTIKMEAVIKNDGSADSPEDVEIRYYLSDGYKKDGSGDWDRVGTENIQDYNMEEGELKTETAEFDAPNKPGKVFNIVVCADREDDIDEKYETNNCSTEAVFRVKGPFNFVIESIALGGGKTTLGIHEAFSVDVTARNLGDNAPTDIKVGYFISGGSIGSTPIKIGTDNIKEENFDSGVLKSETLDVAVAPGTPGTYTIKACADYGNRAKETDEDDNCLSMNVEVVAPGPDPAPHKTTSAVLNILLNN